MYNKRLEKLYKEKSFYKNLLENINISFVDDEELHIIQENYIRIMKEIVTLYDEIGEKDRIEVDWIRETKGNMS